MTAKTYTLLVTIDGDQPADEQSLADRVAGDRLRDSGHHEDPAREIAADHRALREKG